MISKKCALYLFDGYADWEPALAITGLKNEGGFEVVTFSTAAEPILSMGGIKVLPEKTIAEIRPEEFDLLIVPGGDAWEKGGNQELLPLLKAFAQAKKVIAAICGATLALADIGMLDHIPHTSNALDYLKQFSSNYQGEAWYQKAPCVVADRIITANGAAMIEFALQLYETFEVADQKTLEAVKDLYKSGGMVNRLF